jgi:hypothetical protein
MKFRYYIASKINTFLHKRVIAKRKPDFMIPFNKDKIFMERWFLIKRNKIFNIYLHQYTEPDPDHTLHDHPWFSMSFILFSGFQEQTIKYGGVFVYRTFKQGNFHFMSPWHTHRISMVTCGTCRTLFFTGPVIREWGFHNSIFGWLDCKTYKERINKNGT